jgi:hypothetical protein
VGVVHRSKQIILYSKVKKPAQFLIIKDISISEG